MAVIVPLVGSDPHYLFDTDLDGIRYTVEMLWNVQDQCWKMTLYDSTGTLLISNVPLRMGSMLSLRWSHVPGAPPGTLTLFDTSGSNEDPSFEDLGSRVVLIYHPLTELDLTVSETESISTIGLATGESVAITNTIPGWINPGSYGARMDGVTNDGPALAVANGVAAAKGYGLYIPGKLRATTNSVTVSVPVQFGALGALMLETGSAVTINGSIVNSPLTQHFFMNGGTLAIAEDKNPVGYPEWFGGFPDGSDCLVALNHVQSYFPSCKLQASNYFISATYEITKAAFELSGTLLGRPADAKTRLIVNSATADTVFVGYHSNPGGINNFLPQVRINYIETTRSTAPTPPAPGNEANAPAGIRLRFTLYTYIEHCWSAQNLIGYMLDGTVQSHVSQCFAFRSAAATTPTNDFFWGYFLNGNASIGAAGGNASSYITDCAASMGGDFSATGATPIQSYGFHMNEAYVDTFLLRPETSSVQIGIVLFGTADSSLSAQKSGNVDCHIDGAIIDTFSQWGIFCHKASNYAALDIRGGYFAPGRTGATACIGITDSGGTISLTNNQYICWPFPETAGLYMDTVSGVESQGNMALGSQKPIWMNDCRQCSIRDAVNNPNESAVQGAVFVDGVSERNYIAPIIKGGSTVFPIGIQVNGSATGYNEFNCTGIEPGSITGGANNKLTINGSQVTTTGLSGTNLVSGVMA